MRRMCSAVAATAVLFAWSPPVEARLLPARPAGAAGRSAEVSPPLDAEVSPPVDTGSSPGRPMGAGDGPDTWSPPADGPVVREYEPPSRPYGPQHLGLDFAARPGTPVRAAGDGVVAFAGLVGRSRSVAIEHSRGRRTTYSYLRLVTVRPGTPVRRGATLGDSGGTGPGHRADVVHFGYRVNGRPEDPAVLFRPSPPRISLAPLDRPACPRRPAMAPG